MNLIEESYGYSFNDTDVTTAEITVNFNTKGVLGDKTLAAVQYYYDSETGETNDLTLHINTDKFFKNLSSTNENGSTSSTNLYLDRTLAHELTHAIMH